MYKFGNLVCPLLQNTDFEKDSVLEKLVHQRFLSLNRENVHTKWLVWFCLLNLQTAHNYFDYDV